MSSSDDDDDMSSASSESEQIEDEEMEDAVVELNDEAAEEEDELFNKKFFLKEMWQLRKTPYFEEMDAQGNRWLIRIKKGISDAVLTNDPLPGLTYWAFELDKYLELYRKHFSKEELITFIKIFLPMVRKGELYRDTRVFICITTTLLSKSDMISREDLEIDWRPLYELYYEVRWKKLEEDGLFYLPFKFKTSLIQLIANARQYFSENAVQEILDECRPGLCLWDETFCRVFYVFNNFLPTNLKPEVDAVKGSVLWFDEFWHFFVSLDNNATFHQEIIKIFARMSRQSPGQLDFTGKVDVFFTKLLRSLRLLNLPGHHQRAPMDEICILITYMINTNVHDEVTRNLKQIIGQVESFLYPSNSGKHTLLLLDLLTKLCVCFMDRLRREQTEKRKERKHINPIPESMRLTDAHVQEFVSNLVPLMKLALYSKAKNNLSLLIFKCGALLAPKLVLPLVTDQIYQALETLIEPHRLVQTLTSYLTVLVPLVKDKPDAEGKSQRIHAINVLHSLLPGLDQNDASKCMLTFQVLGVVFNLIPIADSSDAIHLRNDLSEEEKELCSATAGFDSIIAMVMDRMLEMIIDCGSVSANQHSSIYSKSTASMEDNLLHRGTCTVVKAIARNASTALFKIALDKLYAFTCEHIFDSITAVHSLSDMITYAVRSRPDLTFHKFLKLVISRLQSCITPESYEEEKVDFVILWWMIIADKVCRVTGTYLLKHWTDVRTLLDLVIPFKKCTEAVLKCREILESVVANLTSVHLEVCKSRHDLYDKPSDEYLPIRHWAESINKKKWNPTWHVPSKEEFEKADEVLKLYIVPQLDLLRSPQGVDKKLILHALMIIRGMVFSTAHAFQLFEGENIPFVKSACIKQNESEVLIVRPKDLPYLTLDGKHVRQEILDVMLPLIDHLLEHTPDDVKSIQEAISIIRLLPNSRGVSAANVKQTYGRLSSLSMLLRDNLVGNRGNIVMLVEEFLAALHKKREATVQGQCFKQQHLDILKKLLKISISQYSQNRARAQNNLSVMLNEHPGSYKLLINDILYYLKAENSPTHEQQKGALHCLVDNKRSAIAMAKYFSVQNEVWPAIVDMQHSEKESILSLLEENRLNLVENYETYRLTFEWQPETIENALKLLTCAPEGSPLQDSKYLQPLAPEIVEQYKDTSTSLYTEEKRHYYELVNRLTDQANDPKRHWKPVEMAHTMLSMLIRNDIPLPDNVVRMMTRLLVHDTHSTRQRAASLLSSWLQISKPKANKREYVIPNKEPNTGVGAVWPIKYGIRDDNRIMMYEEDKLPQTDEEWDSFQFCGKQHWGLYTWPKELITYAPLKEQTAINRSFEEFTETEKFIVNTFKNKEFLEKLRQLYTVDDRKKDVPFDATNFSLFHGLFRNYGDYLCVDFKEMLEDLIQSVKEKDQSFASEVIAGMISGSKLWYWAKQRRMWTWLGPMLSRNFENLSDDNLRIWGVALATICAGSEARLLKPLIDIIFNLISRPSKNVASAGARLFLAHSSFCQFEWRGLELMHKLWHYIKLGEDENQTYANLREKVALCCVACTWFDLPTVYVSPNLPPQLQPKKIQEVVAWYTENMAACIDEVKARDVRMSAPSGQGISDSASSTSLVSDSEVKKAARAALKGSISYVYTAANQNFTSLSPSFIQLLPIYAHYANDVGDDEMYKTFQDVYSGFLNSVYISPEIVQQVISTLTNSLKSNAWWRTEVVLLQFFSTVVFSNPFVFRPYMEEISQAFIQKLSSRQVEVREKAAECLTRFLGSHFIEPTPELIQGFWESSHSEDAIEKHGGVLGLASIVRACPYNVPKFLPDVLMKLCRFVSHRQPVMDTVKKTFSEFKRTHQDSWREHETQFDEEQLMVLRNILVSPNYYV